MFGHGAAYRYGMETAAKEKEATCLSVFISTTSRPNSTSASASVDEEDEDEMEEVEGSVDPEHRALGNGVVNSKGPSDGMSWVCGRDG